MRGQVLDGGDGGAVVGVQPLEEDVDGGQDVAVFVGEALGVGGQLVAVLGEGGEEGEEDIGFQLLGRDVKRGRVDC